MKRVMIIGAGMLALAAGSAQAGGCAYSDHKAKMAAADEAVQVEQAQDSKLLALLQQREAEALERQQPVLLN